MKIVFYTKSTKKSIRHPSSLNISYEQEGNFCNIILYGDINNPQLTVIPFNSLYKYSIPTNLKYLFSMNISWSKSKGFEFVQYSNQNIKTKINDNKDLCPRQGSLKGKDKIYINKDLLILTFHVQVEEEDLSDNNVRTFLENCSKFKIKVADFTFINCQLQGANFEELFFENIKFLNSNIQQVNFSNSRLYKVEFNSCNLEGSLFDYCQASCKSREREDNEVVYFKKCNLSFSSFIESSICGDFIESDLLEANFFKATLIACRFYDCILKKTIYTKCNFRYLDKTKYNSRNNRNRTEDDILPCLIKYTYTIIEIENCQFTKALLNSADLSNNNFVKTNFEEAKLYQSNLIDTKFTKCYFHEANLSNSKLIRAKFDQCQLIKARFPGVNLRQGKFINSELIGVDFRFADLTLLKLDACHFNSANFFKTKRGGIQIINIKPIGCIEWSPQIDGQVQISEGQFFKIISGELSPSTVVGKLVKEGGAVMQNYINAEFNPKNIMGDNNESLIDIENMNNSDVTGIDYSTNDNNESDSEEDNYQDMENDSLESDNQTQS